MNHENAQKLQFEHMKKELFLWHNKEGSQNIMLKNSSDITRDKLKMIIYNKPIVKQYRVVYTKRIVNNDFTTLPYGYCQ